MSSKRKKQSQNSKILAHLKEGKSITPIGALNKFGCFRLSARIYNLKNDGHKIDCKMITKQGKQFASYSIIQQEEKDEILEQDNEITPEIRMWRYVVKRAILDACAIFEDSKPYRNKEEFLNECRTWFNSEDCMIVCNFAQLDKDYVLHLYKNSKHSYQNASLRSSLLSALLDKVIARG